MNTRLALDKGRKIIAPVIVIILCAIAICLIAFIDRSGDTITVEVNDVKFQAELAKTESARARGLGGRESIGDKEAMLFVFDSDDILKFWMKGMKIPIDMIWLSSDKKIIHIEKNVQPDDPPHERYGPNSPARYVLETKAGASDKYGFKIGLMVKF